MSFFSIWQVQFPQLKSMALSHMDNLSKIWTEGPQETLTFVHLLGVGAQNCKSLENLFPHWVATSLTQLEELRVECCAIEECSHDTWCANILCRSFVLWCLVTGFDMIDMITAIRLHAWS